MGFLVCSLGAPEWDEFVAQRQASLFARASWTRVLCQGLGATAVNCAWTDGDAIAVGLPGVVVRRGVFRVLYASLPYAEVIGAPERFTALLDGLQRWAKASSIDQIRMSLWPALADELPGFRAEGVASTRLALVANGDGDALARYPKYLRRDIRKAEREGVRVSTPAGPGAADTVFALFSLAMQRNAAAVKYPQSYFRALQAEIVDPGSGVTLVAELDGRPVAAAVCALSNATVHFLHAGSDPAALRHCPNDALVHAAIEWSRARGATTFDFGYSSPDDQALIRFKEKWGSETTATATWVLDVAPLKCRAMEVAKRVALSRPVNAMRQLIGTA